MHLGSVVWHKLGSLQQVAAELQRCHRADPWHRLAYRQHLIHKAGHNATGAVNCALQCHVCRRAGGGLEERGVEARVEYGGRTTKAELAVATVSACPLLSPCTPCASSVCCCLHLPQHAHRCCSGLLPPLRPS